MVKSNDDVGFGRVHEITNPSGDAGGSLTAHLQVGIGNGVYRAYAYLYHHEQDMSREGKTDSLCARATSATEAIAEVLRRADDHWTAEQTRGLRYAAMEIQESLDEDGEKL